MKREWPIVNVKTKDKLNLYGLFLEVDGSKTAVINIHGTASSFYDEDFMKDLSKTFNKSGISFLSGTNRGAFLMDGYEPRGSALEIFEKCLLDIDAWIEFVFSQGYNKIILEGHSLGTEKVVYYMNKGKYRNKVIGVILLGFSDSFGHQVKYLSGKRDKLMPEAKKLVNEKKGYKLLTSDWLSHSGVMPKAAESYVNFFSKGSELSKAFPLRQGKDLKFYQMIKVPILGVIGDQEEYTIIPTRKAIELLKKENKLAEIYQIKNCDHIFEGHEKELAKKVDSFIKRRL